MRIAELQVARPETLRGRSPSANQNRSSSENGRSDPTRAHALKIHLRVIANGHVLNERDLPRLLEGLVRAGRQLSVMRYAFDELPEHDGAWEGFAHAETAVADVRRLIDAPLRRAVVEAK